MEKIMLELILTNLLVGASLAVDAFAVTVAEGLANPQNRLKSTILQAGYFGFFQFLNFQRKATTKLYFNFY